MSEISFEMYKRLLRIGATTPPNIKHPHVDGYTLADAIEYADDWVRNRFGMTRKQPSSLQEIRQVIEEKQRESAGFRVVCMPALDVLDAAIDGTDIRRRYRVRSGEDGSLVPVEQFQFV